jgi:hypothetical protein
VASYPLDQLHLIRYRNSALGGLLFWFCYLFFFFFFFSCLFSVFWPLRVSVLDFVSHGNHDHVAAGRTTAILTIRVVSCASFRGFVSSSCCLYW